MDDCSDYTVVLTLQDHIPVPRDFADLEADHALLDWAREAAPVMLAQHPAQAEKHIARWLGGKAEYLKA